ncbi:MAG: bifunctional phosphopantothenoylcysteine decarboxylase/phosphopantothenate--cysteine ligase CoaBC, partial [Deltaproteobacteria bacterium]|nr:bifunctional phosphopantothenoylcysteine decarboxylase/phosphopantothenate--cysteine ligase CoaBC [Deltaproteobacteria bacterium]
FALESENLVEHALNKLERKKVDLIVANPTSALGGDENEAIFLTREGAKEIGRLSKGELADRIWDEVRRLLGESP